MISIFKHVRLALILVGWMTVIGSASATDIELSGSCGWSISGGSIDITAGKVANREDGGSSGSLRLQVWATPYPYSGGSMSGYVLGTRELDTLGGGYSYNNISGSVPYFAPPDGTYYTTVTVEEYGGGGYTIVDYLTLSGTSTFGAGGGGYDGGGGGGGYDGGGGGYGGGGLEDSLSIEGTGSWSISGSVITIGATKVANTSGGGSSGTLRLQVWATSSPYSGGSISGYTLGTYSLGVLDAGYSYNDISGGVSYTAPPPGTYYTTLTLEEYDDGGYSIVDYLTFSDTSTFGGGAGGGGYDDRGSGVEADLSLGGSVSYRILGRSVSLNAGQVINSGDGTSGTLRLRLWATRSRYAGGSMFGYPVATRTLGVLDGGYNFNAVRGNVRYVKPRRGAYFMTLALEEYTADGYVIVDYRNFNSRLRVR